MIINSLIVISLLILIISLILFLFCKRPIKNILLTKIVNKSKKIPKLLFQTYINKEKIPAKVYKNINKYASEYRHIIFDDEDCKTFLKNNYIPEVLQKFNQLKLGAHKADLLRYCYLYLYGGVYADIKTEFIKPISEIFKEDVFYSVLSINRKTIYQGIIATPPGLPIFEKLIKKMLNTSESKINNFYPIFTAQIYQELEKKSKSPLVTGINSNEIILFKEDCSKKNLCNNNGGLDRYKLCCYIYQNGIPIIKTRYFDYPW